jgi:hypothetical protein
MPKIKVTLGAGDSRYEQGTSHEIEVPSGADHDFISKAIEDYKDARYGPKQPVHKPVIAPPQSSKSLISKVSNILPSSKAATAMEGGEPYSPRPGVTYGQAESRSARNRPVQKPFLDKTATEHITDVGKGLWEVGNPMNLLKGPQGLGQGSLYDNTPDAPVNVDQAIGNVLPLLFGRNMSNVRNVSPKISSGLNKGFTAASEAPITRSTFPGLAGAAVGGGIARATGIPWYEGMLGGMAVGSKVMPFVEGASQAEGPWLNPALTRPFEGLGRQPITAEPAPDWQVPPGPQGLQRVPQPQPQTGFTNASQTGGVPPVVHPPTELPPGTGQRLFNMPPPRADINPQMPVGLPAPGEGGVIRSRGAIPMPAGQPGQPQVQSQPVVQPPVVSPNPPMAAPPVDAPPIAPQSPPQAPQAIAAPPRPLTPAPAPVIEPSAPPESLPVEQPTVLSASDMMKKVEKPQAAAEVTEKPKDVEKPKESPVETKSKETKEAPTARSEDPNSITSDKEVAKQAKTAEGTESLDKIVGATAPNWEPGKQITHEHLYKIADTLGVKPTTLARELITKGYDVQPSKFGSGKFGLERSGKKELGDRFDAKRLNDLYEKKFGADDAEDSTASVIPKAPESKLTWSKLQDFSSKRKQFTTADVQKQFGATGEEAEIVLNEMQTEGMIHSEHGSWKDGKAPEAKTKVNTPKKKEVSDDEMDRIALEGPKRLPTSEVKPPKPQASATDMMKKVTVDSPQMAAAKKAMAKLQEKDVLTNLEQKHFDDLYRIIYGKKK